MFLNDQVQIWTTVWNVDQEQKMLDLLLMCRCGQFEIRKTDDFLKKIDYGFYYYHLALSCCKIVYMNFTSMKSCWFWIVLCYCLTLGTFVLLKEIDILKICSFLPILLSVACSHHWIKNLSAIAILESAEEMNWIF